MPRQEPAPGPRVTSTFDRRYAVLAAAPLLAIGVFNVGLVVLWGADFLWGFLILLPVIFLTAVAWIAFRVA